MSFTIRYNETRLADPDVSLVGGVPEGATLTVGKAEPGVIRILIDTVSAFDSKEIGALVDVTFEVLAHAPSGDTFVEIDVARRSLGQRVNGP